MTMSDQYDDGRYDPGSIEMPGGWCVPKSQAPEPFTFPRIQRGGIKYPKPTKETPMPRMTKAQIENELRLNNQLMDTLRQRRSDLQKDLNKAIPAEPRNHTMFTVSVKFKMRGQSYQFLILRYGGQYYTTGGKPEHAQFASWEKLCEWLEGPEVYSHSDLEILQSAGKAVSFTSGAIERMDPSDLKPPF